MNGFRAACLPFFIRTVRYLLPVAGLVLTFWLISAHTPANADVLPSKHALTPAKTVPRGPLAANHRARAAATTGRRTLGQRPRRVRSAPRLPVVHRLRVLQTVRRTGATVLRPTLGATLGRARWFVDPHHAATAPAPERDDRPGCRPPHTQPDPPRSPAVHRARTVPPAHGAPVRPRVTPVAATSPIKQTCTISRAPAPRAVRTLPDPPGVVPVSGQGESDCVGGKTPTGTGDVPRVRLRPPGLWFTAYRQDRKIGQNIADEPSCSPD